MNVNLSLILPKPKLARFSDKVITFAVNGLLYPNFTKNGNRGFLCKTEPKPNRKWNRRTVTALEKSWKMMKMSWNHGNFTTALSNSVKVTQLQEQ